jgi:two-component system KDP operon response regulator KdpE
LARWAFGEGGVTVELSSILSPPEARVLIVEDEPTTRKAVGRVLSLMDCQVDEAASGSDALDKLTSASYDLMLLDLRLPGIDGVEVMKQAQEICPDLSVIVFTAHGTFESAVAAVKAGAVDYLIKPCSNREIEAAVNRALERCQEQLHRQYLLRVIGEAAEMLQGKEKGKVLSRADQADRFLQCGSTILDREKLLVFVVSVDGMTNHSAELTLREVELLSYLMQNPEVTFSCRELARSAFDYDLSSQEAQSIIRPHISRLRRKIEPDPADPSLIHTVRGKGYMFTPPRVEAEAQLDQSPGLRRIPGLNEHNSLLCM